jgi:hypothetical protein
MGTFAASACLERRDCCARVPRPDQNRAALADQTVGSNAPILRSALRVGMNDFNIEPVFFFARKFRAND